MTHHRSIALASVAALALLGPVVNAGTLQLGPTNAVSLTVANVPVCLVTETCGGGGGSGTVTSVSLSSPEGSLDIGGTNPVTVAGTITADLPSLIAAGTVTCPGSIGYDEFGRITAAAAGTCSMGGSVTDVGLSLPPIFTVSGSPVTTTGTLTAVLAAETANEVFAGPSSGSPAAPTFRALASADIPSLPYVSSVSLSGPWGGGSVTSSGTIGTGSLTAHSVLIGNGSGAVNLATIGTAGQFLIDQGAGNDPVFGTIYPGPGISLTGAGAPTINNIGILTLAAENQATIVSTNTINVPCLVAGSNATITNCNTVSASSAAVTAGTSITVTGTNTINNAGLLAVTGSGITNTGGTVTNSGVTSNTAGAGISITNGTGASTITNTGITSLVGENAATIVSGNTINVPTGAGGITAAGTCMTIATAGTLSFQVSCSPTITGDWTWNPGTSTTPITTTFSTQGSATTAGIVETGTLNTTGIVDGAAFFANITNTASSSSSKLLDFQVGAASKVSSDMSGNLTLAGGILVGGPGGFLGSSGLSMTSTKWIGWNSGNVSTSSTGADTGWMRSASGSLYLSVNSAGSGLALTETAAQSGTIGLTGVSGTNTAAGTLTIQGALATGNAASGPIDFAIGVAGSSGTTQQTGAIVADVGPGGNLVFQIKKTFTVATLPSCSSSLLGAETVDTDLSAPTYLGSLTGSGTVVSPVMCNGTIWVSY